MAEGRRLDVLDGMRGIAILLVLWYHIWEISWLPAPLAALQFIPETGFVGVHLFFFISGFVIFYPFVRAKFEDRPAPSWGHFAYRRAIKIVPSYLLSLVIVFAIGYAHYSSFGAAIKPIVTHLLFIHTWFGDTYGSLNGVLWTLAVEVEFYVIFPLICWAFLRRPLVTFAVMVAIAIAWRVYASHCCFTGSFALMLENLPGYIDIFACGMLASYGFVRFRDRPTSRTIEVGATLSAIAGFAALLILMQNLWSVRTADQWSEVWQIYNRTLLGITFAVIGFASLFAMSWWKRALGNPILVFFSLISYNLYIYHQVIARELLTWHLPPYTTPNPRYDPHWQLLFSLIAFPATIAFAALITYGFERPLLKLPGSWWSNRMSRFRKRRVLPDM
ncbi:MAG: acyltransferase [Candidatus Eremiobacteraeota bacterium]|nr:acyltransferase [Candidatus Eremiobacteraeota bacterium]